MNENPKRPSHGNVLERLFNYLRDVIEAADVPFVLLVLVVLPFVVPFVPAWVTAENLRTMMNFPPKMAFMGGVTVELLGFAGAILLLRAVVDYIETKDAKQKIAIWLTGGAYVFYILSVIAINVILDAKAGKDWSYVWVIGFLCLMSIPSGLLSASRITNREDMDRREMLRRERREDRITRYAIRHGSRPTIGGASGQPQLTDRQFQSSVKYASDYRDKVVKLLDEQYQKDRTVIGATEMCKKLKLDPRTQRSEIWKQITAWKRSKGLR